MKKQPPEVFFKTSCSKNFWQFHKKTFVLEFLFNKVAACQVCCCEICEISKAYLFWLTSVNRYFRKYFHPMGLQHSLIICKILRKNASISLIFLHGIIHQKVASETTTFGWVDQGMPSQIQTFLNFARVLLVGLGVCPN